MTNKIYYQIAISDIDREDSFTRFIGHHSSVVLLAYERKHLYEFWFSANT